MGVITIAVFLQNMVELRSGLVKLALLRQRLRQPYLRLGVSRRDGQGSI